MKRDVVASVEVFYGVRGKSNCGLSIPETTRRIVEAGFGVEVLLADHWMLRTRPSEETIEQLTEICREAEIMTTHACLNTWRPEAFREEVALAARIGVPLMVIHPYVLGLDLENYSPPESEVRDLCRFALDSGVMLALENLGKTGIGSLRRALDIVGAEPERTGLGICVDVGHAHRSCARDGLKPEAFLKEFSEVLLEVHVDDNFGDEDIHLPPGRGNIEWPPVIEAIGDLPDKAIVCLEITSDGDPIQTLKDSREFLLNPVFLHA